METRRLSEKMTHYFARARMALLRRTKWAFFGGLVMSLIPMESDDIETAGVNCNGLLVINPKYFLGLSSEYRISLVAHEVLHPAFEHFARQGMREASLWNVACDIWINGILEQNGLVVADDWITRRKLFLETGIELPADFCESMSAEMIYQRLLAGGDSASGKQGQSPGDLENSIGGDMQAGGDAEKAAKEAGVNVPANVDWSTIVIGAAAAAEERDAGNLPGSEKERLGLKPPVIDWRQHVQKLFTNATRMGKLTFAPPKRRYTHISVGEDPAGRPIPLTLPSSVPDKADIAFILDTSGSMNVIKNDILGEVNGVRIISDTVIWLMAGDTKLQFDEVIGQYDEIPREFTGWGGTHFNWVFKEIAERQYDGLGGIIFATDGWNSDTVEPRYYPKVPMIWLIYDNPSFKAPFGEVIHVPRKTR